MKSIAMIGFLALVAVVVASTLAADLVEYPSVKYLGDEPEQAPRNDYAKAGRDTVYLMGALMFSPNAISDNRPSICAIVVPQAQDMPVARLPALHLTQAYQLYIPYREAD